MARHPVTRAAVVVAAIVTLGCSAVRTTPLQELAWERWKQCDRFPTVTLKEIRANGDIWVWTHHGTNLAAWKECERAARAEQIRAGRFSAAAMPALSEADARALVRFAYFTDRPPTDTAYLLSPLWGNMPPDVKVFPAGTPVTFFYGIEPTGRILTITSRPSGSGLVAPWPRPRSSR
jgi:hypothetical protein